MGKEDITNLLKTPEVIQVIRENISVNCWTERVLDEDGYPTPHRRPVCRVFLFGEELYREEE